VFGEIGQTILSLLCDVRNFQYTIAQIDGLSIRLEENASLLKIIIPESQYDLIIKSLLTSNEYVFSLAKLNMDEGCSSHLVAIENKNLGTYSNKTMSFAANSALENDKGILYIKAFNSEIFSLNI
jgi:MAD (mothers against decapentaplegic) interacting protein